MEDDLHEILMFFAENLNSDKNWICPKLENCKKNLENVTLLLETLKEAQTILEYTPKLKHEREYSKIKDKVEHLIEILSDPSDQITGLRALLEQLKNESYT